MESSALFTMTSNATAAGTVGGYGTFIWLYYKGISPVAVVKGPMSLP